MVIRSIEPGDWPAFFPVFHDIVEAGETYAYPLGLTPEQAWDLWVEGPPGVTVVAVDESGAVLGSAKSGPNRPARRYARRNPFGAYPSRVGSTTSWADGAATGNCQLPTANCQSTIDNCQTPTGTAERLLFLIFSSLALLQP